MSSEVLIAEYHPNHDPKVLKQLLSEFYHREAIARTR